MVEKGRRKQDGDDEKEVRSLLRVREEAAFGIGSGIHSTPVGGSVNIERIGLTADYRYSATFVHNPNYVKGSSGIGIVWVSIPKTDDDEEEAIARLRKLRRGHEEDGEGRSEK